MIISLLGIFFATCVGILLGTSPRLLSWELLERKYAAWEMGRDLADLYMDKYYLPEPSDREITYEEFWEARRQCYLDLDHNSYLCQESS